MGGPIIISQPLKDAVFSYACTNCFDISGKALANNKTSVEDDMNLTMCSTTPVPSSVSVTR